MQQSVHYPGRFVKDSENLKNKTDQPFCNRRYLLNIYIYSAKAATEKIFYLIINILPSHAHLYYFLSTKKQMCGIGRH